MHYETEEEKPKVITKKKNLYYQVTIQEWPADDTYHKAMQKLPRIL